MKGNFQQKIRDFYLYFIHVSKLMLWNFEWEHLPYLHLGAHDPHCVGVFIVCENRSDTEMGASTLLTVNTKHSKYCGPLQL
jgi:hypothetical protein